MMLKQFLFIILSFWFAITLISCTGDVISPSAQETTQLASSSSTAHCVPGQCPCQSPAGLIPHGQPVTLYRQAKVPCASSCETVAQTVTCHDGKLSADANSLVAQCQTEACQGCLVEAGSLIQHGAAVPFYKAPEARCHETCEGLQTTRQCIHGKLTGDTSFNYLSCKARSCTCDLPFNQGRLYLGQKNTFFKKTMASCGESCATLSKERTCRESTSGTGTSTTTTFQLSESSEYSYLSCQDPLNCGCTLPGNLGILEHGGQKTLYKVASVECGQSCDTPGRMEVRCQNGKLTEVLTSKEVNLLQTEYKYNCTASTCVSCQAGGINFSGKRTFYGQSSVNCYEKCAQIQTELECRNGQIFINNILATTTQLSALSWYCNENCKSCTLDGGRTTPTGTIATFFKTVPVTSPAACGQSCPSTAKKCVDGEWVGDPSYTLTQCNLQSVCQTEGGGAPPWLCQAPWGSVYLSPGSKITVFNRQVVNCNNDSCAQHAKLAECDRKSGMLKVRTDYIYPTCREQCP